MQNRLVFVFKVGGKYVFIERSLDFPDRPKTSAFDFIVVGNNISVVNSEKCIYQFFFYIRFENVFANEYRLEIGDTQFFPRFPTEGVFYAFSIVDVAAYGSIPFSGVYLYVKPVFASKDLLGN